MFNSVALDVVIGLVFIYLLYSLLATVLSELIATVLALRARNLKEAVDRMLNDENEVKNGFLHRLWDSLKLMKNPKNDLIDKFYGDPEIKYLGSSGIFKSPSNYKSGSFSKTVINVFFGSERITRNKIDIDFNRIIENLKNDPNSEIKLNGQTVGLETFKYLLSLWEESEGSISKFKLKLEGWFDRTMEQATEWYRRKIQVVLLILGFCLAFLFNADTFTIVKKLSVDKDAREKMVSMANAYLANNNIVPSDGVLKDSNKVINFNQKLDSLLQIKKTLEADITSANTILGTGVFLPDSVRVVMDPKTKEKTYTPPIDPLGLSVEKLNEKGEYMEFKPKEKWGYFFRLLLNHFWGYLITAIAISLGAPFWFDLLNKLMKLRTSQKQETEIQSTSVTKTQPVVVQINSKTDEEAVG